MTDKYCPTRNGTYTAYRPEYQDEDGQWHEVPTGEVKPEFSELGIPGPRLCSGISKEIGMYGRAQAWALAWEFSAREEASTGIDPSPIRVAQYTIVYEIRAKRLDLVLPHAE